MRIQKFDSGLKVLAPAKINLFLELVGKRPDGYHDLETVMLAVDLCDELRIEPHPKEILVEVITPIHGRTSSIWNIPSGRDNLVFRALELLRQELGIRDGLRVQLFKRIPAQAGMGGGSSDVAAALVAGCWMWTKRLEWNLVRSIASRLGSDINFFLESHLGSSWLAFCTGRGEIVRPKPLLERLHFAIVQPPKGCSTVAVFRQIRLKSEKRDSSVVLRALGLGNLSQLGGSLYNGLEEAASLESDWIGRSRDYFLTESVQGHLLSGSGSARFALCSSRRTALTVSKRVGARLSFAVAASSWHTPPIEAQLRALG